MELKTQIEIVSLASIKGGMAFHTSRSSHETMLVSIPGGTIDNLLVHQLPIDTNLKTECDDCCVYPTTVETRTPCAAKLLIASLHRFAMTNNRIAFTI